MVEARSGRSAPVILSFPGIGALAQLGEHSVCNRKVASSSLARSIADHAGLADAVPPGLLCSPSPLTRHAEELR